MFKIYDKPESLIANGGGACLRHMMETTSPKGGV